METSDRAKSTWPTRPKFDPNFDHEAQSNLTQLDFGPWGLSLKTSWVQIGFIKYIIGLILNLNPFWGQPDLIGPVFGSWGLTWPIWTQKLGPKLGWTRKNFPMHQIKNERIPSLLTLVFQPYTEVTKKFPLFWLV